MPIKKKANYIAVCDNCGCQSRKFKSYCEAIRSMIITEGYVYLGERGNFKGKEINEISEKLFCSEDCKDEYYKKRNAIKIFYEI